jgi:hypothetical protein
MSDTPITDELDAKAHLYTDIEKVFALCRKLERELAAAVKLNEEFWPSTLATRDELRVTKEELTAIQARVALLRGALAGLVGVGDEKGLEQMEFVIRNHSAPDADKMDMLNAIRVLITTLPNAEQKDGEG